MDNNKEIKIFYEQLSNRQKSQLKLNNLVGKKIGKLKVQEFAYSLYVNGHSRGFVYKCKCDCGKEIYLPAGRLNSKDIKSCGCYIKQILSNQWKKNKLRRRIPNIRISSHPLRSVYGNIKRRCYNPKNNNERKNYYEKGIRMCDEWLGKNGLINFYNWAIANGYTGEKNEKGISKLTIDRIDNSKGYSPDNCRWVDWKTQARNKG